MAPQCKIHRRVAIPRCMISRGVAVPRCIIHCWADFLSNMYAKFRQKSQLSQGTSKGTRRSNLMQKKTNTKKSRDTLTRFSPGDFFLLHETISFTENFQFDLSWTRSWYWNCEQAPYSVPGSLTWTNSVSCWNIYGPFTSTQNWSESVRLLIHISIYCNSNKICHTIWRCV